MILFRYGNVISSCVIEYARCRDVHNTQFTILSVVVMWIIVKKWLTKCFNLDAVCKDMFYRKSYILKHNFNTFLLVLKHLWASVSFIRHSEIDCVTGFCRLTASIIAGPKKRLLYNFGQAVYQNTFIISKAGERNMSDSSPVKTL